jgi:hypothetical protein
MYFHLKFSLSSASLTFPLLYGVEAAVAEGRGHRIVRQPRDEGARLEGSYAAAEARGLSRVAGAGGGLVPRDEEGAAGGREGGVRRGFARERGHEGVPAVDHVIFRSVGVV